MIPSRARRSWERLKGPSGGQLPLLLAAVVCAGYTAGSLFGWGAPLLAAAMGDFGLAAAAACAGISCLVYACKDYCLNPTAWRLFAFSSLMLAAGNGVWGWYEVVLRVPMPPVTVADFCFLLFAPPTIVGVLMLAKRPHSRLGWGCLVLDSWLIAGSLLTVSWSLALGPAASGVREGPLRNALWLAYPLLDIVLVSVVLALHFRQTPFNRAAVYTVLAALGLTVLCDALFTLAVLRDDYQSGRLLDAGWFAGSMLMACAPWAGRRDGEVGEGPDAAASVPPAEAAAPPARTAGCTGGRATGRWASVTAAFAGRGTDRCAGPPMATSTDVYVGESKAEARAEGRLLTLRAGAVPHGPIPEDSSAAALDADQLCRATRSLAALTPYVAATVCMLGILYNMVIGREPGRFVLLVAGTVVLALVARQAVMLLDNVSLTRELARQERHFRSLVQGSSDVIMIAAADGVLSYVSPASRGVYGRAADELVGTGLADMIHPDDRGRVLCEVRRFLAAPPAEETSTRIECRIRSGGGTWLNVESTVNRYRDGLIFNSRDVTERVRLQAQLQHSASHDPLTDLPNRALFTERVHQAVTGRRTGDGMAAVFFLDLDGFKAVNDSVGHQAGDELLVHVARRLRQTVRTGDTVARFGGDEFAALVCGGSHDPTIRETQIRDVADRLRGALAQPYRIGGAEVRIAASIGIAFAEPGIAPAELLRNADLAMYRAKSAGKGCVELYAPQMLHDSARRAELSGRLHAVLRDGTQGTKSTEVRESDQVRKSAEVAGSAGVSEDGGGGAGAFTLVHQPVADLATGGVAAVEAQPRWSAAAQDGQAPAGEQSSAPRPARGPVELGRELVEEAVEQAAEWYGAGHRVPVTVRVPTQWLLEPEPPAQGVEAILARYGLPACGLIVLISEYSTADLLDRLERRLSALKRLGVRVAVDTVGAGQDSLAALRRLPVDILKFDGRFLEGLVESPRLRKITAGMIRLATDLGVATIADGVDDPDQALALRAMGCTHAQGTAICGPLDERRLNGVLSRGFSVPQHLLPTQASGRRVPSGQMPFAQVTPGQAAAALLGRTRRNSPAAPTEC